MYAHAKKHFKKVDPLLHAASLEIEVADIVPSKDLFRDIVWTIIGQQLSSRAADAIFARFQKLFPRGRITVPRILALSEADMRASGLSGAKARAIHNFARAVHLKELDLKHLPERPDAEIIESLTKVKGIGPWTAEMVLMFSLGRTDIFSRGDLGLRKGIIELYGFKSFPSDKKLEKLTRVWSPYRTYAARVLWRVADRKTNRIGRKRAT